ncbi:MAG: 50S ribosomal protein L25 [Gemmataceae bacterium]
MAESVEMVTQPREHTGSRAARALRRSGLIPAVLYGHEEATVSFTLGREELERAVRHGVHVVNLKTSGNVQKALIRDLQWDYLGKELLHVDFYRIREGERVEVTVSIEIRGTAPGVQGGGVLEQPMHQLHIECPADSIPETIRVIVSNLQLGQAIHVKELTLPEGVKALADDDALVIQVVAKEEEKEEAAALPGEGGPAEPERIGRQKPAEEEE